MWMRALLSPEQARLRPQSRAWTLRAGVREPILAAHNKHDIDPNTAILVVDDVWGSMGVVVRALQTLRLTQIDRAPTASQALKLAAANRYRLVITEVVLPDGSGIELLRRLRMMHVMDAIRLMVVTARRDLADVKAAKVAGADAYLIKPFSLNAFRSQVLGLLCQGSADTTTAVSIGEVTLLD
jgi:two-component system chemotaxis response regulator CheY